METRDTFNTASTDGITISRLEPQDLMTVPVILQAFDNQWLPRSLLRQVIRRGSINQVTQRSLRTMVRTEYLRALVNLRQVIINRAYLYNNQIIFHDYTRRGRNRDAFKALLNEGAIIAYLFTETSPVERPPFSVDEQGFAAWQQLCQEVQMHCLRLSWNNEVNESQAFMRLGRPFYNFAQNMASGDTGQYARDLALTPPMQTLFRNRLIEVAQVGLSFIEQERAGGRNDYYREFVTAGDNPALRLYDSTKLFAAEIKQCIDLAYNSYLADALGGYLLTPPDSLLRTALQEWVQIAHLPEITGDTLILMLQEASFPPAQEGNYLRSFVSLTLETVRVIRQLDEWSIYIESLENLVNNPMQFATGSIYQHYLALAQRMTNMVIQLGGRRGGDTTTAWLPVVELVIDVAGATGIITWTTEGILYRFEGEVSPLIGTGAAPLVARLVIRGQNESTPHPGLETGIDFIRSRLASARAQWSDVQQRIRSLPGFREWQNRPGQNGPSINYQV